MTKLKMVELVAQEAARLRAESNDNLRRARRIRDNVFCRTFQDDDLARELEALADQQFVAASYMLAFAESLSKRKRKG